MTNTSDWPLISQRDQQLRKLIQINESKLLFTQNLLKFHKCEGKIGKMLINCFCLLTRTRFKVKTTALLDTNQIWWIQLWHFWNNFGFFLFQETKKLRNLSTNSCSAGRKVSVLKKIELWQKLQKFLFSFTRKCAEFRIYFE